MGTRVLVTEGEIAARVKALGEQISSDYAGQDLLLVCMLRGAAIFFADLARAIDHDEMEMEFIQSSSYRGTRPGELSVSLPLCADIRERNVLIVEDVIDTGRSMSRILASLRERSPRSLKLCALVDKRGRREAEVAIDYTGFTLGEGFLIGYGFDLDGRYRQLRDIREAIIGK
ncbi:MAG: hypoxanthine phosphoribosyltransferase [Succinivibrionaceae bacterium]|nr:hypoxanthine phosphoribosyltransferase [Succinivibrionaceae bacterium]